MIDYIPWLYSVSKVLGQFPPRKIAPPALILTLTLNQTLTLIGGQISPGQLSEYR